MIDHQHSIHLLCDFGPETRMNATTPSCLIPGIMGSMVLLAPILDIQRSTRILRALTSITPSEINRMVFEAHQVGEVEILRCPREKAEWMALEASREGMFLHWKADKQNMFQG